MNNYTKRKDKQQPKLIWRPKLNNSKQIVWKANLNKCGWQSDDEGCQRTDSSKVKKRKEAMLGSIILGL